MSRSLSRRQGLTAGTALGAGALTASLPGSASATPLGGRAVHEETRSLDELYRAALAEGGRLVVYAGGDIASSYPNDDASLFLYKLYAETYGWDWVARLAAQDVQFARGTHTPALAINNKQKVIGVGAGGAAVTPAGATLRWAIPEDGAPFMAWGQRAAIFRRAAHPEAAKLYLNWWLSTPRQQSGTGWSVRTDIVPPTGIRPAWEYPNAHFAEFPRFMADRAEVERWKQTFTLYFGEVEGAPSPGRLGLHPGR